MSLACEYLHRFGVTDGSYYVSTLKAFGFLEMHTVSVPWDQMNKLFKARVKTRIIGN